LKIALIGKTTSVTHWREDCTAGLIAAGHQVLVCSSRDPKLAPALERLLLSRSLGSPRAAWLARSVKRFAPDLIMAVGAYEIPEEILERLHAFPGRPPMVAWVGDAFAEAAGRISAYYDLVAYTDSLFIERHKGWNFPTSCIYLPHAANPRLGSPDAGARVPRLAFVANQTPGRVALLGKLRTPVALYGPGWRPFDDVEHVIEARRIGIGELTAVYRRHVGVLNIRHEKNVLHGLNQRSFDPYLVGTPVVSDDQPDLRTCFEEGSEVLVYRSAAELDDIAAKLGREPGLARAIGAAGYRRVMAEHRYEHRIAKIAAALR
jgi:spore maturation protein CgeB